MLCWNVRLIVIATNMCPKGTRMGIATEVHRWFPWPSLAVKTSAACFSKLRLRSTRASKTEQRLCTLHARWVCNTEFVFGTWRHDSMYCSQPMYLFFCLQEGWEQVAAVLLEFKANTDIRETDRGISPLYIATSQGHARLVRQLLEAGTRKRSQRHALCMDCNC